MFGSRYQSNHVLSSRWGMLLTALALLAGPAALSAYAVDAKQAADDWKTLSDFTLRHMRKLSSESDLKKGGQAFVDEWRDWRSGFEPFFGQFKERYGSTYADVTKAFEGIQRPLEVSQDIGSLFTTAENIKLDEREKQFAQWASDLGRDAYQRWSRMGEPDPTKVELKYDYTERALRDRQLAKELDPDGTYDEFISKAQAANDQTRPEWEKVLKDLAWPGHNSDFAGPGDPDTLAAAALDYLKKAESWSKPEYDDEHIPIAACVTAKGWEVSKKTVLGEPTQYSLNCFVAFKGTKDPKIAYGYHMVFYTQEEPGIAKAPPFRYGNSRQYAKFKMLMSNVPAGRGAGGTTSGCLGLVLRIVLAALLLVGGLVAARPIVKSKVAALGGVCDAMAPMAAKIGVIMLVVGLLCFLRALVLHFAPFADLVPQVLAVLVGLVLAKSILIREPKPVAAEGSSAEAADTADAAVEQEGASAPGDTMAQAKETAAQAAQKAQDLVYKSKDKIEKLERIQVPLGLACLAAGIIHVIAGGLWLL